MADVLIIDDDEGICETLSALIRHIGHRAESALTIKDGLDKASSSTFDLILLDVRMPDGDGLQALSKIKQLPSLPEVIIMTGRTDRDAAEFAIKGGAWDYLQKPFSLESIIPQLVRVFQYREAKAPKEQQKTLKFNGVLGSTSQMRKCRELAVQAANSNVSVFITGESGTGKEVFANAIHASGRNDENKFVVVDCAALPHTLIESVLFGHEKGAFTGADRSREGLIKQADEGTLFLDEVGELPLSLQKSFLRVLQERRFRPVGGKRELASNFRLIAATNRNLEKMVEQGKFRSDLLFRLQGISIEVPPLRDRKRDIGDLLFYFLSKFRAQYRNVHKGISPDFFEMLFEYDWPGNVRELANTIKVSLINAGDEPILFPVHLPMHIRIKQAQASLESKEIHQAGQNRCNSVESCPPLRTLLEKTEIEYLHDLVSVTRNSIKEMCDISGLSRTRLYERLRKYNILHSA